MLRMLSDCWAISTQALVECRSRIGDIARATAWPAILLVLCEELGNRFADDVMVVAFSLLGGLAWCFVAIQTHRLVLLSRPDGYARVEWNIVLRYALIVLGVYLVGYMVAIAFGIVLRDIAGSSTGTVINAFFYTVPAIAALYVIARLSLLLPNRAVGLKDPLGEVVSWSKNNGWKLTIVLFLPPLVLSIPTLLIDQTEMSIVGSLLSSVLSLLITVYSIVLLSVSYRGLSKPTRSV